MEACPTFREFIEPLVSQFDAGDIWLRGVETDSIPEEWEGFMVSEVDRGGVLLLCQAICAEVFYEISMINDIGRYNQYRHDFHGLMKAVCEKANGLGVFIELSEIDLPVTCTEVLVRTGIIEEVDGNKAQLSEVGWQLAEATEKQLRGGGTALLLEKVPFRIIKTPAGPAPEEIRQKWIGIELAGWLRDAEPIYDFTSSFPCLMQGKAGYVVLVDEALEKLEKVDERASMWFREWFSKGSGKHFVFEQDVTEPIE
ncbi:MAG: hypothetical protein WCV58_01610 [Patescibacteria group bacterium]